MEHPDLGCMLQHEPNTPSNSNTWQHVTRYHDNTWQPSALKVQKHWSRDTT